MPRTWRIEHTSGSVADRHALQPDLTNRGVLVHEVDQPTMVLGSSQRAVTVGGGIDVVRRRSGGGAVLLRPGEVLWLDILIPRGDPLWSDDVGRAALWLGGVWCAAIRVSGVDATVHREPMVGSRWSDLVCFAGRAPGEVLVDNRKVLGVSQRRNRTGAWFQCAALLAWPVDEMVELLGLQPPSEAIGDLQALAGPLPIDRYELQASFLEHLP